MAPAGAMRQDAISEPPPTYLGKDGGAWPKQRHTRNPSRGIGRVRTSPLSLGKEGLSCLGAPAPISLLTRALWRLEPWPAFGETGTSKASVTAAGEGCRGDAGSRGVAPETKDSYPAYMPKDSVTGPGAAGRSLICPGAAGGSSSGASSSEGTSTSNSQAMYLITLLRQSSLSMP